VLLIVPQVAPPQPVPDTVQLTAAFAVPATEAANCCENPTATETLVGVTTTATGASTVSVAFELVAVPIRLLTTTENSVPLSEVVVAGVA